MAIKIKKVSPAIVSFFAHKLAHMNKLEKLFKLR